MAWPVGKGVRSLLGMGEVGALYPGKNPHRSIVAACFCVVD